MSDLSKLYTSKLHLKWHAIQTMDTMVWHKYAHRCQDYSVVTWLLFKMIILTYGTHVQSNQNRSNACQKNKLTVQHCHSVSAWNAKVSVPKWHPLYAAENAANIASSSWRSQYIESRKCNMPLKESLPHQTTQTYACLTLQAIQCKWYAVWRCQTSLWPVNNRHRTHNEITVTHSVEGHYS